MSNTHAPNARLKELMDQEPDLTRPLIGEIVGMSRPLVDMWLRPKDSPNYRPMPDRAIRLLEFELGYRKPQYTRFHRGFANMPLKENSTLWCIVSSGQAVAISDKDCLVKVTDIYAGQALLSNGAVIDPATLKGYLEREVAEDFGKIGDMERKSTRKVRDPVRCWRSKADWEQHVERQRAWNKLASRIQTQSMESMEDFTVDDIESAELALFGNIQK